MKKFFRENAKLKALGAKAPKNEKCPIFILKGMRAKAKEREEKQKVGMGVVGGVEVGVVGGNRGAWVWLWLRERGIERN